MKNIFLLSVVFFSVVLNAQIISGKIENENGRPIAETRIYIDGTQISALSTTDGSFEININGQVKGNLIFQKDGYESATVAIQNLINKKAIVKLLKIQDIEEVVLIPYTEEAYRKFITYFLDSFIGFDKQNVTIRNVKTLKFSYDKSKKTLRVKAPKTLIINNKNLGYTIHYNLVNFEADFQEKMVSYSGTSYFSSTSSKPKIKVNRMNAYLGSLQHFVRSCYSDRLKEEGFNVNSIKRIENPKYPSEKELEQVKAFQEMMKGQKTLAIPQDISEILSRKGKESPFVLAVIKASAPTSDFIENSDGKKILNFKDILQVIYTKSPYELKKGKPEQSSLSSYPSSYLHIDGNSFELYPDGNTSDPELLISEGYFSQNKIEKFLPSDYKLGD